MSAAVCSARALPSGDFDTENPWRKTFKIKKIIGRGEGGATFCLRAVWHEAAGHAAER